MRISEANATKRRSGIPYQLLILDLVTEGKGLRPGGEPIKGGIEHVANAHATKLHTASVTLTKTKMEDIMNICDMKNLVGERVVRPQSHRQVY